MDTIYFKHGLGDSEEERAFHRALGRNVILWGRLEACITGTLLNILHDAQTAFPAPPEMPMAFTKRIELWKRLFKSEETVSVHKARALKFANDALALSKRRNALIHATVGRFSAEAEGAAARSYKHIGPQTFVRDFRILTSDLMTMEADITALYGVISPIAVRSLLRSLSPQGRGLSDSPEEPETTERQDR